MLNKLKVCLYFLFALFLVLAPISSAHAMDDIPHGESYIIQDNGNPVSGATLILDTQSRQTNSEGIVNFEPFNSHPGSYKLIIGDKVYSGPISEFNSENMLDVSNHKTDLQNTQQTQSSLSFSNPFVTGGITLVFVILLIVGGFYLYKYVKSKLSFSFVHSSKFKLVVILAIVLVLIISLFPIYFLNKETINSLTAAESKLNEIDGIEPTNLQTFANDRVVTLTWDAPKNADQANVVGYLIRWGKKSGGMYTDSKQTVHTTIQLQPLDNNVEYQVAVQSLVGGRKVDSNGAPDKNNIMVANGTVSKKVLTTAKATTQKVDAMRSRDTGFFDDFNLPAGNFDETKWNTAYSGCVEKGYNGTFINSQFHAHNNIKSRVGQPYCDRAAVFNRPRATFDISKGTELNPAVVEFDFDGVNDNSAIRDIWYIDFAPTNSRKDGMIMDTTSHNEIFGDDNLDPGNMLRLKQHGGEVTFQYYPVNGKSKTLGINYACEEDGDHANLDADYNNGNQFTDPDGISDCVQNAGSKSKITKYSPVAEPSNDLKIIPNVRRHWVIEFFKDKTGQTLARVSIDGFRILESYLPKEFVDAQKYFLYNTLFSYNTAKDQNFMGDKALFMNSSMLHWDNFGFTGDPSSNIVHNYVDGGPDGSTPFIGTGLAGTNYPAEKRIIPIPDQIGSPVEARVHFTLQNYVEQDYVYHDTDNIVINPGTAKEKKYPFINPSTYKVRKGYSPVSATNIWYSDVIKISGNDLVTGNNTVVLNLSSQVINVHIELEYTKNSAPAYTQPQNIFTTAKYNPAIMPAMASGSVDAYLFQESNLGLTVSPSTFGGSVITTTVPTQTTNPSPSATATISTSPTTTRTVTQTPDITRIPVATSSPTVSQSPTVTSTASATQTIQPTTTSTGTVNPTQTVTRTPSTTAKPSSTVTKSPTGTLNPSTTVTGTVETPTQTISSTPKPTLQSGVNQQEGLFRILMIVVIVLLVVLLLVAASYYLLVIRVRK